MEVFFRQILIILPVVIIQVPIIENAKNRCTLERTFYDLQFEWLQSIVGLIFQKLRGHQKKCKREREDLKTCGFLQKPFYEVTERLTTQNFCYLNGIQANLNFGGKLTLICGEKQPKMRKNFFINKIDVLRYCSRMLQ